MIERILGADEEAREMLRNIERVRNDLEAKIYLEKNSDAY